MNQIPATEFIPVVQRLLHYSARERMRQENDIRAETIGYEDYLKYRGESGARDAGRLRLEGKEYRVQEGDVLHFRFNV